MSFSKNVHETKSIKFKMSIMSVQFKYKVDNETENKLIQEKELIIRVIVVYQKYSFQSVL